MKFALIFCTTLIVCLITPSSAYGQRVYADSQQSEASLLSSVNDKGYPVDTNYANSSRLISVLDLLGLGYAMQNLQFTGAIRPTPTTPLMIRFGSEGSILGLFDGIQIQRTNGGISNTVGTNYTSNGILDLLGLNADPDATEVTVPVPGTLSESDGLRFRISSVLAVDFSANLYYAFFITPPSLDTISIDVCEAEDALISISNFQPGYTYKLYDALTGGKLIASGSTDVLSVNANNLSSTTYYLEAVEGDTEYTSSRTSISITIIPKPGHPDLDLNVNSN